MPRATLREVFAPEREAAAAGIVHPLHHELFDVDESCLAVGAAIQVSNALAVLER